MRQRVGSAQLVLNRRVGCSRTRLARCRHGAVAFPAGGTRKSLGVNWQQTNHWQAHLEPRAAEPLCVSKGGQLLLCCLVVAP